MTIDELTEKGYTVTPAMFAEDEDQPTVYFVEGFGLGTYVKEDDEETITALAESRVQELSQQTLPELQTIAAELDIKRRSKMSKDELIGAIHAAEQSEA